MKHWILSLFLLFFIVEVFSVFPTKTKPQLTETTGTHWVKGLINVHTELSDGFSSIPQISAVAESLGNSFVVFADQNSLEGRQLQLEKQYGSLDAFVEIETTTPSGDLLFFFSHTLSGKLNAQELSKLSYDLFLGNKKDANAFVSISHPSHVKNPWTQLERFPDGIELFNFDSLFLRRFYSNPVDFLGLALLYPLNPFMASLRLTQPYPKDFAMWDNMNTLGLSHFGFWSSQFKLKINSSLLGIQWPTYRDVFSLASNIVFLKRPLSESLSERKKEIYQSIREGRLAISFDAIHPFSGNDFLVKCGELEFRSGDKVNQKPSSCVTFIKLPRTLPYKSHIRLIRNGEVYKELVSSEKEVLFPLEETGSYRVEVWVRPHSFFWILLRKWVPYLYYNPILFS